MSRSGGEPTVRDDLPGIFDLVRQRGFGLVQLNTNGLRLAQEADYAATLADAGLESVYLQWDAVSDAAFRMLRGRDCRVLFHRLNQLDAGASKIGRASCR